MWHKHRGDWAVPLCEVDVLQMASCSLERSHNILHPDCCAPVEVACVPCSAQLGGVTSLYDSCLYHTIFLYAIWSWCLWQSGPDARGKH